MSALHRLADLGVTMWDFSTGQRIDLDSFETRLPTILKAEFAQQFREQIRKHTRAALRQKFQAGYVVGGEVFGYDNVGPKGAKRRVPNPEKAAIVVEIYERYARGEGYRSIAWALNARGVPAPSAQRGRPSGWSQSTILAVLDRSLYRGVDYYGRMAWAYGRELGKKRTATREQGQVARPKDEWLRHEDPSWRIVPPALAAAVDERRGDRNSRYLRATNGQLLGRPSNGTKYLLSGFLRCPCGAGFEVMLAGNWAYSANMYVCSARRRKGPQVCPYKLQFPIEEVDEMILSVIEGDVLAPRFIEQVLDTAFAAPLEDPATLQAERARLVREMANLTTAIAAGGDIPALTSALKERDKQLRVLDARLVPHEPAERETLRAALEQRVSEWKTILRSNPRQARMVLQQLIGPITVEGEPKPAWMAQLKSGGLLAGMVMGLHMASPTGFEPVFWP
jgi:recombinase/recombinase-like zinc beta ribbon protein